MNEEPLRAEAISRVAPPPARLEPSNGHAPLDASHAHALLEASLAATGGGAALLFDQDLAVVAGLGRSPVDGRDAARAEGARIADLLPGAGDADLPSAARAALAGTTRRLDALQGDRVVEVVLASAGAPGGAPLGAVLLRDVTEQRARCAQAAVTSRHAALGQLVAGIAHEINNPLAALFCAEVVASQEAQEIEAALRAPAPIDRDLLARRFRDVHDSLTDVRDASQRISRVVRGLSAVTLKDAGMRRVRLAAVVEEATTWYPAAVGRNARLRVHDEGAPDVFASEAQLRLLVMHLVDNATASIPPGRAGEVTVRLARVGPHGAALEVSDNGAGIQAADLERIFDPFFCGRGVGQGVGLGLHICRAIVESHGGSIAVRSRPGQGSTFRVELPAFRRDPPRPDRGLPRELA